MKKGLTLLTTIFLTLSLASCGSKSSNDSLPNNPSTPIEQNKPSSNDPVEPDKPSSPDTPVDPIIPDTPVDPSVPDKPVIPTEYKDSIELFNASLEKMQQLTYEVKGFGPSNTNTITGNSVLYIYENLQHKPDELYFEKISNGEPVKIGPIKIGVSFAREAYIKGSNGKRKDAQTKDPWTPFNASNAANNYPKVTNYGEAYNETTQNIVNDFGKVSGSYINFVINENTITENSKKYTFENDVYTMNFDILIDKGIDSEGIGGYKNQVNTMSGKTLDSVNSIKLNIKLDKDLKVIEYSSNESYVVDSGIAGITANVSNNLNYKFKYFENSNDLVIKSF